MQNFRKQKLAKTTSSNDLRFIENLAKITQISIKKSELNFLHGLIIFKYLKKYLKKNKLKKITILETRTAKGFESVIMS